MIVAKRKVAKPVMTASSKLRLSVPADAVVFVNDRPTSSTGADRHYVSHGLESGKSYKYSIRVEYTRDGQQVTESKVATLIAGVDTKLAFGEAPQAVVAAEPVETKLSVTVPENAKVTLAGAATTQTGVDRVYRTTRLSADDAWEDYTVRVESDGEVQERTITLQGGESRNLVFTFGGEAAQLAAL